VQSLAARHPWRLDVPLLLCASLVLLAQGLTRPAMQINALIFWQEQYSILSNIARMYREGRQGPAILLAACSIAYPAFKIAAMLVLWAVPFPARSRSRIVRALRLLGRWAMIDVLAVMAIVLISRTVAFLEARPLPGIYIYAAGIVVLMIATMMVDRLARHGRR
jgi:uncharacterized paraquat-inducible protein A